MWAPHAGNHSHAVYCEATGRDVALVRDAHSDNARLIAAAPDLLEALQDAEFLLRKAAINPREAGALAGSMRRCTDDARAAIEKATGEAS